MVEQSIVDKRYKVVYSRDMSKVSKLREELAIKIGEIQDKCTHAKDSWVDNFWAPGHYSGRCRVCLNCEKVLEIRYESQTSTTTSSSDEFWVTTISGDNKLLIKQYEG